ncbi:TetR/AcrR family transcriptional regulator [Rhodococcus sp. HNM0569]|uniref:TetR/AcrR family transcriptional regulator n=1 Tax=Rhodococcus sp. HNM0569 TaxID=2716340 RepID=UPI003211E36A
MQQRVTKRRSETRQRVLDAALDVFADQGFGRATVEQICDRAGFTRGAFYSNFASLDDLFFAMWERNSDAMLTELRAAAADALSGDETVPISVSAIAERALAVVPVDGRWYRVNAEFTAHALRHPPLERALAARENAIADAIVEILGTALAAAGRRVVGDPRVLARALVAVHDGTSVQCLVDADTSAWRLRRDLVARVVDSYTEPLPEQPEETVQ